MRKLYRSEHNKKFAGVIPGLVAYVIASFIVPKITGAHES